MTNTLHRQGKLEDLKGDYVIFTSIAKDIKPGTAPMRFRRSSRRIATLQAPYHG